MLAAGGLLLAAAPPATERSRYDWERDYRALGSIAAPCREADRRTGPPHVINPEREAKELARRMLRASPGTCPGVAAAARMRLELWVGTIERADADDDLLRVLHKAADLGLGGPRDPVLAERLARMLWLISEDRPRLPWTEEERWAYLLRPDIITMLEARVALWKEVRPQALLGEARLRQGTPAYDPPRAITLLESAARDHEDRLQVTSLLTDGRLVPVDYPRAAMLWVRRLQYSDEPSREAAELLRIGRLAEAAARTPIARAATLRILSAAAIDGGPDAKTARDTLLRRLDTFRTAALPAHLAPQLAPVLAEIPIVEVAPPQDGPRARPVKLRALVGPDGRVVVVEMRQGTGQAAYDRAVLTTWAEHGHRADLAAFAAGRFVWTDLPPLLPRYATDPS